MNFGVAKLCHYIKSREMKNSLVKSFFYLMFVASALMTVTILSGCSDNKQEEEEIEEEHEPWRAIEEEVMAIHDEVMPQMSELNNLENRLEALAKERPGNDTISTAISNLQDADSLMWAWMYAYDRPEGQDTDAIIRYLTDEKEKVTKVKDAMLTSMENARQILNANSND